MIASPQASYRKTSTVELPHGVLSAQTRFLGRNTVVAAKCGADPNATRGYSQRVMFVKRNIFSYLKFAAVPVFSIEIRRRVLARSFLSRTLTITAQTFTRGERVAIEEVFQ
jgi:hypothetical protein